MTRRDSGNASYDGPDTGINLAWSSDLADVDFEEIRRKRNKRMSESTTDTPNSDEQHTQPGTDGGADDYSIPGDSKWHPRKVTANLGGSDVNRAALAVAIRNPHTEIRVARRAAGSIADTKTLLRSLAAGVYGGRGASQDTAHQIQSRRGETRKATDFAELTDKQQSVVDYLARHPDVKLGGTHTGREIADAVMAAYDVSLHETYPNTVLRDYPDMVEQHRETLRDEGELAGDDDTDTTQLLGSINSKTTVSEALDIAGVSYPEENLDGLPETVAGQKALQEIKVVPWLGRVFNVGHELPEKKPTPGDADADTDPDAEAPGDGDGGTMTTVLGDSDDLWKGADDEPEYDADADTDTDTDMDDRDALASIEIDMDDDADADADDEKDRSDDDKLGDDDTARDDDTTEPESVDADAEADADPYDGETFAGRVARELTDATGQRIKTLKVTNGGKSLVGDGTETVEVEFHGE